MMKRRKVPAIISTFLAGCMGVANPDNSTTLSTSQGTTTQSASIGTETMSTTTTAQSYTLLHTDPSSLTASEVRERIDDVACSTLTDLPTTCPGDDGRLTVTVSPAVGELLGDSVQVTIANQTAQPFEWGPYDWQLQKWDDTGWRRIAPLKVPAKLGRIPPGDSHTYRIAPVERRPVRSSHAFMTEENVTIGGLGPGVYGFSTKGYLESAPDHEFALAAVFGLAGDAPPVRPTDGVRRVTRDGSTLVVHADAPGDRTAELAVSLVGGDPDVRLLPEHVQQLAGLLNTLPYAATDGVKTIRYVGHSGDVGMVDTYLSNLAAIAGLPKEAKHRFGFCDLVFEASSS